MAASLDDIDAGIMTALVTLEKTSTNPTGVFNLLGRWAPEAESTNEIFQLVLTRLPALLVGLEGDIPSPLVPAKNVSGVRENVSRSTWILLIAAQDIGTVAHAVKGQTSQPGVYSLVNSVLGVVNNLYISGTFRDLPVQYLDTRPYIVKRGQAYVYAVRIYTDHLNPDAEYTDTDIVDMDEVDADINRPEGSTIEIGGESTDLQNPRAEINVTPVDLSLDEEFYRYDE